MNRLFAYRLARPLVGAMLLCVWLATPALLGSALGQTASGQNGAKPAAAQPKKIKVALYSDKGASGKGPPALRKTFADLEDMELVPVMAEEVRAGKLKEFDVVIFPGGSSATQSKSIGPEGREAVRQFIDEGGTYIGICAGCYLACSHSDNHLHVMPAKIIDRKNSYRGAANLQMEPSPEGQQWLNRSELETKTVYHNGPVLKPIDDAPEKLIPLAYYREEITKKGAQEGLMVNTPAIAASGFGKGWVVGISPHPEQTDGLKDLVPTLVRWTQSNPR